MFSWLNKDGSRKKQPKLYNSVADGLKNTYRANLLPLEQCYLFHDFHSPPLDDSDFDAKPMILLIGQYSTGKTTFIKYLLERDFPGIRIGPEPTTDKFIVIMHGDQENIIPGNALVVDPRKQFRPLSSFGNAFLNKFQCSTVSSPVLENITIIDTPGILSGEKQRVDRGYDFTGVLQWFAERADRIMLFFDAHKLDISDELRRAIESFRGHDDKIRIVLNKADMVNHQQLMRIYGALMWFLGKVFNTPEVARVYIGSFWDQPLKETVYRELFEAEMQDLFTDFEGLPRSTTLRKLNDLVKRARLAKAHACIIGSLKKEMPLFFHKKTTKKRLIRNLDNFYNDIQRQYNISRGDFPELKHMQEKLLKCDTQRLRPLQTRHLKPVDRMLAVDIPLMVEKMPEDQSDPKNGITGGAFESVVGNSFCVGTAQSSDAANSDPEWTFEERRHKYDEIFQTLHPVDGKVSAANAKSEMVKSKLPNSLLGKIWKLSGIESSSTLDADEFALAMYLIELKLEGYQLPKELPERLVPSIKKVAEHL